MNGVSLGFAFSAGLLASLNPCAFAMLPAFVAYYLGLDDENRSRPSPPARAARGLAVGVAMSAGFVAVFTVIGALVSLAGGGLLRYQDVVGLMVGLALAGLGAWLAAGRELHVFVPNPVKGKGQRDLLSAGIYGVGFGFASLACTLPIFLIVVGAAFAGGSLLSGLALFLAYSAGMATIVLGVSLGAALFKGIVARFLRVALPYVQRASGVLLILAGTYLAVRQLEEARLGTLSELQPHATEIGAGLALAAVLVAGALWLLAGEPELERAETREPFLSTRASNPAQRERAAMEPSYAVIWRGASGPVHTGKLQLGRTALEVEGRSPHGRLSVERLLYVDLSAVRIGRAPEERINGELTLLLERRARELLYVASLGGIGIIHELADRLAERAAGGGDMIGWARW